jgi:hypothetical protein
MFEGRRLLIATKHHKEQVIAPVFEKELAVQCFTSDEFDTDSLGTFSGEIERKNGALFLYLLFTNFRVTLLNKLG